MAGKEAAMRHVTILGLMTFVLICGVGTAALTASTTLWDHAVFSSTLLILTASILLAVYGRRAFWLGFALFGWAYLVLTLIPPVEARLLSTKGLTWLGASAMNRHVTTVAFTAEGRTLAALEDGEVRLWDAATGAPISTGGTPENFRRIGHSLVALLLGLLGASLARWLQGRDASRPTDVRV
jgi:hypothetical protein